MVGTLPSFSCLDSCDYDMCLKQSFSLYNKSVVKFCANITGTIFAYGQTSSGKTYTMMGTDQEPGIIKQAVAEIFNTIENVSFAFPEGHTK